VQGSVPITLSRADYASRAIQALTSFRYAPPYGTEPAFAHPVRPICCNESCVRLIGTSFELPAGPHRTPTGAVVVNYLNPMTHRNAGVEGVDTYTLQRCLAVALRELPRVAPPLRCAVVGNAGSLVGTRAGAVIDAHDFVIRCECRCAVCVMYTLPVVSRPSPNHRPLTA
jgi:hypothetical protein